MATFRSSLFTLHAVPKKKQDDSLPTMSHTSTSFLNSFHEQSQNSNFTFKNSRETFRCIILEGRVWSSQRWELWHRLFDRITYICPSFDSMPNQRKETDGCKFEFKHHADVTPHFRGVTLSSTRLAVWSQINTMVRNTLQVCKTDLTPAPAKHASVTVQKRVTSSTDPACEAGTSLLMWAIYFLFFFIGNVMYNCPTTSSGSGSKSSGSLVSSDAVDAPELTLYFSPDVDTIIFNEFSEFSGTFPEEIFLHILIFSCVSLILNPILW